MKKPLVSIIVPMYNVERYVAASLRSAQNQTYSDIEILCINDGSSDGTRSIAEEALGEDNRARIIDQANGGLSAARNTGLGEAKGEYVLFLDSDDMLASNAIEFLVEEALSGDSQIVAAKCSDCDYLRTRIETGKFVAPPVFRGATLDDFYYQNAMTNHSCGKLYASALFADNGILFPVGRSYEDIATTYRLMAVASRIACTQDALYYYRPNEAGISHTYTLKNVCDLATDYQEIRRAFGDNPSNPQRFYLLTVLYTLLRLINKTSDQEGLAEVRGATEVEFDELFKLGVLSLKENRTFSAKLLLRRTAVGKSLLRRWGK